MVVMNDKDWFNLGIVSGRFESEYSMDNHLGVEESNGFFNLFLRENFEKLVDYKMQASRLENLLVRLGFSNIDRAVLMKGLSYSTEGDEDTDAIVSDIQLMMRCAPDITKTDGGESWRSVITDELGWKLYMPGLFDWHANQDEVTFTLEEKYRVLNADRVAMSIFEPCRYKEMSLDSIEGLLDKYFCKTNTYRKSCLSKYKAAVSNCIDNHNIRDKIDVLTDAQDIDETGSVDFNGNVAFRTSFGSYTQLMCVRTFGDDKNYLCNVLNDRYGNEDHADAYDTVHTLLDCRIDKYIADEEDCRHDRNGLPLLKIPMGYCSLEYPDILIVGNENNVLEKIYYPAFGEKEHTPNAVGKQVKRLLIKYPESIAIVHPMWYRKRMFWNNCSPLFTSLGEDI